MTKQIIIQGEWLSRELEQDILAFHVRRAEDIELIVPDNVKRPEGIAEAGIPLFLVGAVVELIAGVVSGMKRTV